MVHAELVERAKSLIDDLATTPRFAGSAEETTARARCRAELEKAGFTCEELPFAYSQWLARWAVPVVSFATGFILYAISRLALAGNTIALPLAILVIWWPARTSAVTPQRNWVLTFPWSRATSANLEARRGSPAVWLVAHLDSKSQTVPMLLRITGTVSLYLAALLVTLGGLAFSIWGSIAEPALLIAQF